MKQGLALTNPVSDICLTVAGGPVYCRCMACETPSVCMAMTMTMTRAGICSGAVKILAHHTELKTSLQPLRKLTAIGYRRKQRNMDRQLKAEPAQGRTGQLFLHEFRYKQQALSLRD